MVNKTQFYKTKVALAVVLSFGLAACGDSDGDANTASTVSDTLTEAVDNTLEQVQGTGSVQGTVLDTNGLPVMGATVSLAGQSVETDASGYYYFTDVPAPGVDGVNGEAVDADVTTAGAALAPAYIVTITAPAGYAGATVNVVAEDIQVDSGNNGTSGNTGNTDASGEQTTWFDGFLAQAQTAELPKFASTLTGVLRDCDTGAALPAGVKVALDFDSIDTTTDTTTNNGTNVTIGVPVFTAMTAADGSYTFADIPSDSLFDLTVEGYSASTSGSTEAVMASSAVSTTAEGVINNLGDLNVCLITSNDGVAPYISSVDSVITDNTDDGFKWQVLSQGKDGTEGIVLRFNEALDQDAIDTDAVIVTSQVSFTNSAAGEKVEAVTSAVVADDGLSMTITLAAALPEMTKFSVWMPRYQYQDTSENRIITGDASGTEFDSVAADNLVFDVAGTSTGFIAAVAAVASSHEFVLNVSSSVIFTATTADVSGDSLTVIVTDSAGPATFGLTASGITVGIDITGGATAADLVAAINGDAATAAVMTAAATGTVTTPVVALGSQTLAGFTAATAETAATAAGATGSSEFGVSSDTINDTQFKTEYVRTRLCTYIAPITDPGTIIGEQLVKTTIAADDTIDAVGVFWDNAGSATISNLNGQHDQTEDLLQQLWNRKNTTSAQTIIDDTAVVTGDLNDATSVIASVVSPFTANIVSTSVDTTAGTWTVVVEDATHLDQITVTPTAAFNIIGTPITVTLEDKVAPTTVLQDSYNYADTFGADHVNSVASDDGYANGGELSNVGTSGSDGSPILYVTPRLFAEDILPVDDANFNNRTAVFKTLADGNTLNDATTPAPYVTSGTNFVYDVNAFANWAATSADVGVAFSENINLVTGQTVDFALSGAAANTTLTGFVANNSKRNEDYIAADTDQDGYHSYLTHGLVQMTTNDVVNLANLDHNAVIDYTGAVSDTVNANVALSDSLVVIADAIPPFVAKAELTATEFVVTFNEAITTTGTASLNVINPDTGAVINNLLVTNAVASAGDTVLTWSGANLPARAAFSNSGTIAVPTVTTADMDGDTFGGGAETETVTGVFSFPETVGGDNLNHALLSWGSVEDTNGNAWNDYHDLYVDVNGNSVIDSQEDNVSSTNAFRLALADLPMYLATDTIIPFGVEVQFGPLDEDGIVGVDATFDITITATNPISLTNNAAPFAYSASTVANVGLEDGWRALDGTATNITNGWDLTEIRSHFRIINTLAVQAALQADVATSDGAGFGNGDGTVSPEEFVNSTTHANVAAGQAALLAIYDANDQDWLTGTSASFNTDGTELTINAVIAANIVQQSTGFSFVKLTPTVVQTDGAATDPLTVGGNEVINPANDVDVRYGQVESTLEGTNGEEQSQDVRRSF